MFANKQNHNLIYPSGWPRDGCCIPHIVLSQIGFKILFNLFKNYIFSFKDKVPRKFKTRNKGLHLFVNLDIPQPSDHRKVVTATEANLRLFKNQVKKSTLSPSDRIDGTIRLSVYQVIRKKGSSRSFRKRLVDSRTIDIDNPGNWEQFNVLSAVQTWIQDPPSNLGLVIIADGGYSLQKVVNFTVKRVDRMNSSDANAPSLSVLVRESLSPSRQHRSTDDAQDCEEGSNGKLCCRHKLWISFKDIGWDSWILAPEGYQAYFCDGSCPRQYKMAHQFSGIKSLVNSLDPSAIPGPCCSPTKMSSLPIAHYNRDGHAVVSVFENMIVDECKCAWQCELHRCHIGQIQMPTSNETRVWNQICNVGNPIF